MDFDQPKKIFDKLNKDWLIELLVYNKNKVQIESAVNDLVNHEFVDISNIYNSDLKYFINKEELETELKKNNGKYFEKAIVRIHIELNLQYNKNLIDNYLKEKFNLVVQTYDDYILYYNLINDRITGGSTRFNYLIKSHLAKKFNFEEMLKLFTNKLIFILNNYNKEWVGFDLFKEFSLRIDFITDISFWEKYFSIIDDRIWKIKTKKSNDELLIENVIDNAIRNNILEIKI